MPRLVYLTSVIRDLAEISTILGNYVIFFRYLDREMPREVFSRSFPTRRDLEAFFKSAED